MLDAGSTPVKILMKVLDIKMIFSLSKGKKPSRFTE